MTLLREFFIFYTILQIVQCHHYYHGSLDKSVIVNKKNSAQILHVFAENYKPYLYKMDDDDQGTYFGINYFLIKTIGENLNMSISLVFASSENRLENWKPLSKWAIVLLFKFKIDRITLIPK